MRTHLSLLLSAWLAVSHSTARADDSCSDNSQEIDTDRPDVTNSSLVVPQGSLQAENGVNWTGGHGGTVDAPNTRMRFGLARCTEILVDLPDYAAPLAKSGGGGVSSVAPAIKRQFESLPSGMSASAVVGALLPSGTGYGPYIQLPWAQGLTESWKIDGMLTATWFLGRDHALVEQATVSLARDIGPDADIFLEYIGDFRTREAFRPSLNFGGSYRVTKTQQLDIHVGFGLSAPGTFFGIGYSLRFDDLL